MIKDNISQCRLIEPKEGANYLRQKHSVIRPHICLKEYVRTEVSLDKKKRKMIKSAQPETFLLYMEVL